jgi:hypothetical protein
VQIGAEINSWFVSLKEDHVMKKVIFCFVLFLLFAPISSYAREIDGFMDAKWGMKKEEVKKLSCFNDKKWEDNKKTGGIFYLDLSESLPSTNVKVQFEFYETKLYLVTVTYLAGDLTIENFKRTVFAISLFYHDPVDVNLNKYPASAWWKDDKGQIMLLLGEDEDGKSKLAYAIYEPDTYKRANQGK